jgi:pimeloyl-ACP methyl ester carboxylesterase
MDIRQDTHDVLLFGGTGINKLWHWAGQLYYRELSRALGGAHIISLAFAGILHPVLRHHHAKRVGDRKTPSRRPLVLIGHSQGGVEALWQAVRSERQVDAVFCLSAPLGGAPLAKLVAFLNRLPRPLRYVFEGVLQMIEGSEQLTKLQDHARSCAAAGSCPEVFLIVAAHDGLVPLASGWLFPDEYPADKLHRVLLLGGEGPVPDGLPNGIEVWRTLPGMDNHITMIGSRQLHHHILAHLSSQEEVEVVIGSV